jgi:gamma-glutamyltranspeptidase/glutathione hydrolase
MTPRRSKRAKTHHSPEPKPTMGLNVYTHPEPQFVHFGSRRSVVHSTKGIVSSTQPLATAAGIDILKKGGNAAV